MDARPRKIKLRPTLPTRVTKVTKERKPKKRWKEDSEEPRIYSPCTVNCPACKKSLSARSWGPKNRNVEVETSAGWVLLSVSGDIRFPCPMCLAFLQGYDLSNWHKVSFDTEMLPTSLQPRPRQHWARKHKVNVRSAEGEALKAYSKLLLCSALHEKPSETQSEVRFVRVLFFHSN